MLLLKIKEYGLICLWLAEHSELDTEVVGNFAYHFKDMIDDVTDDGYLIEEKNDTL